MKLFKSTFASLLVTLGICTGCIHSMDDQVSFKKTVDADEGYSMEFKKATRHAKVIRDFETRFEMTATYLSPSFRTAMSKRFNELYEETRPLLEESSSKAGFLVAIYSPDSSFDLRDNIDSSLLYKSGENSQKPVLIKALRSKKKWQPFFPYVNPWTKEYLVIFDQNSIDANSDKLVEQVSFFLSFHSSDAEVKMSW